MGFETIEQEQAFLNPNNDRAARAGQMEAELREVERRARLWEQQNPAAHRKYVKAQKKLEKRLRKPGRNDPCLCGSGKKSKKCCGGAR